MDRGLTSACSRHRSAVWYSCQNRLCNAARSEADLGKLAARLNPTVRRPSVSRGLSMEALFRVAFWLVFGWMIAVQAYFACRARLLEGRATGTRTTIKREGWGYTAARAVRSLSLVVFLVLYAINLPWLGMLWVPFPDWLRWMGVGLATGGCVVYAWSRATLGKEWSSRLQTREQHRLVTSGPYAWMRHPIYAALMGFLSGLALVTANWFFIAIFVLSAVDLILRIPKEERMMIEKFGEEYKAYMQRRGRFFPR